MDYRKLIGIIVVAVVIFVSIGVGIHTYLINNTFISPNMHDVIENYGAEEETKEAISKYSQSQPCEVITTKDKGLAIVVDGLLDRGTTQKILDLMNRYHIKATFFIEGQNASNEAELVRYISKTQEVGNYTFNGLAEFHKKNPEYQLSSLCKTQKILEMEIAKTPELFRAPRTEYTDEVLKAVSASGLKYAVKENINLQYIADYESADRFIKSLKPGSILAIKTGQPVYQKVEAPTKLDETPAFEKQPTVKEISDKTKTDKLSLVDQLDLFFKALEDNHIETEYVSSFRKISLQR